MAQSVAVVRATLPDSVAEGAVNFTKADFGTVAAAIIVICRANDANNPQSGAGISVGFWDGTNQAGSSLNDQDNVTTTNTHRASNDAFGVLALLSSTGAETQYTVAAVTDGISITMTTDQTTVGFFCTVLLLGGVSANLATFTPNATENSTTESGSLGFAPEIVFFTTIGATAADVAAVEPALISFGFARSDGTHRMLTWNANDNVADEALTSLYSETRCVGQVANGAVSWAGEVTTFGADTYTMTTRDGASGSDVVFALALGGDLSFDVGTLTTPTSATDQVNATDIAPDALLVVLGTVTGTSVTTDGNANGYMIGMADDDGEFCHNISAQDGAGTTSSDSVASADRVINLDTNSSGPSDLCDATVVLNSADFTLTFSASDATARKGWWVAFGAAAAAGGNIRYPAKLDGIGTGGVFPGNRLAMRA